MIWSSMVQLFFLQTHFIFNVESWSHQNRLSSTQYLTAYCLCFSHRLSIFLSSVFSSLLQWKRSCGDKRGDERSCFLAFWGLEVITTTSFLWLERLGLGRDLENGTSMTRCTENHHNLDLEDFLRLHTILGNILGLCLCILYDTMIMSWLLKVIEVSWRDGQQAPPCEMSRPRVLGFWTSLRFGATHRFSPPREVHGVSFMASFVHIALLT